MCSLRVEMLYGGETFKNGDFRKKFSFFQNPADQKTNLRLAPKRVQFRYYYAIKDYWLKASITDWRGRAAPILTALRHRCARIQYPFVYGSDHGP